jgi:hypothetical protein
MGVGMGRFAFAGDVRSAIVRARDRVADATGLALRANPVRRPSIT